MRVLSAPVIKYSQVLPWKMVGLMTLKPQACPFWNLKDQPLNGWIQTNKGTGRDKMPCITSSGCSKLYKFTTLNCSPNVGELLLDANAWKVSYIKISQNGKILFFHHAFRWPSFEKAHPRAGKKISALWQLVFHLCTRVWVDSRVALYDIYNTSDMKTAKTWGDNPGDTKFGHAWFKSLAWFSRVFDTEKNLKALKWSIVSQYERIHPSKQHVRSV